MAISLVGQSVSRNTDIGKVLEYFIDNNKEILSLDIINALENVAEEVDEMAQELENKVSELESEIETLEHEKEQLEIDLENAQEAE